jgi:type IV pilus assembly protein PilV
MRSLRLAQVRQSQVAQQSPRAARSPSAWRRQAAFAMVEALVAVLIVNMALLGACQLILRSLREASDALTRTKATQLVSDMMDRIRANPDAGDAYDCASYSPAPAERGCSPSGVPALECSPRELAEDDLAHWQSVFRKSLPLAGAGKCDANVTHIAGAGSEPSRYRVEVSWQQPGEPSPMTLTGELVVARRQPI